MNFTIGFQAFSGTVAAVMTVTPPELRVTFTVPMRPSYSEQTTKAAALHAVK